MGAPSSRSTGGKLGKLVFHPPLVRRPYASSVNWWRQSSTGKWGACHACTGDAGDAERRRLTATHTAEVPDLARFWKRRGTRS